MSSIDVCNIMEREIKSVYPEIQAVTIPVADGGEGTVDCFLAAMGGRKNTSAIEMACCAGLPLAESRLNPLGATTYGAGQLIMDAVAKGAEHIILGLGGSASNDGGCGLAAACGVRFTDMFGKEFVPAGGTLRQIEHIHMELLDSPLKGVTAPVMLVKMVLIQHLFGIRSLRQTIKEIEVNLAYRWFLGLGIGTNVPHFATVRSC